MISLGMMNAGQVIGGVFLGLVVACGVTTGEPVNVPAGLDHRVFDRLLQTYVDDRGRVDYHAWNESETDRAALRAYLAGFASPAPEVATGSDQATSLINAYNALTIDWILQNLPLTSIKKTRRPWKEKRHRLAGALVSLDDIEHQTLRPALGYRVHAVLVCAARSCPPLHNRAYSARDLDQQLNAAMRRWLARADLNRFSPEDRAVTLSKIFSWYGADFNKADAGLAAVLARYAPERYHEFLKSGQYRIRYQPYDWSLNTPDTL